MGKDVKKDAEARQGIVEGIDIVADIVKTTVGPSGRNIVIRNQISPPIITNDGATIAKSIQLKDNAKDTGAQLIISAANKTNEVAGDGTTTTTILTQEMIHKCYELATSSAEKINVVKVKKEMLSTAQYISDYLQTLATPVQDNEDIKRVATISSGDEETGHLIAEAFKQAGDYGYVIVEDSKTGIDSLTSIQGMKLPGGMVNPYLYADLKNRKTDLMDADLLLINEKLDNAAELMPVLDNCVQQKRKLVIMCSDVDTDIINMIVTNRARGVPLNVSIIRIPGYGELRENMIEDICLSTGAKCICRDNGTSIRDYSPELLGELKQIIITEDDTVLKFKDTHSVTGQDLLKTREDRAEELNNYITNNNLKDDDAKQYKRRISNLISGISIFEVGGNSEVEIQERKLRIEDAINSVQSAKEEGIVPGGGYSFLMAYMNTNRESAKEAEQNGYTATMTIGEQIIYDSLLSVTKQIAQNAGYDGDEVVRNCIDKELGFNALSGEYEDLINTGVINSAKVDRYSVLNAASVAATIITMGGYVIEENEPEGNVLQLQAPIPGMM